MINGSIFWGLCGVGIHIHSTVVLPYKSHEIKLPKQPAHPEMNIFYK